MAKVSGGAIRLIDKDGDPLDDGNGRLNINATLEAASVNVGDVDIRVGGTAANTGNGTVGVGTLRVTIAEDTTGVLSVDDNGGSLTVDNAGLTSLESAIKAEDSLAGNGHLGFPMLAVRKDDPSADCGDGDYGSLCISSSGSLYTQNQPNNTYDSFAMIDVDNSDEQLSATIGVFTYCLEIMLQADESNTGYIMVGDVDVADNRGMKLNPGDTIILDMHDTRGVYLWGSADNQNLRCLISKKL